MPNFRRPALWSTPSNSSPVCNSDPACRTSRAQLAAIVQAQDDSLLRSIRAGKSPTATDAGIQTLARTSEHTGRATETKSSAPSKRSTAYPPNWLKCSKELTLSPTASAALAAGVR